ncbi:SDR family oxidoreductase [Williamsia sp. 1135]|uniref:SDR family oxidoreductase n=1 Tax=Williamsia sp. 1135 TaxID=1889262 RepID=UPI000A111867|nr:SDR family oxidoreductase [Williamsia sp. 1135]ORM30632.1 hypothetical protein BFL43_18580 [Williamsia sp. 1135]
MRVTLRRLPDQVMVITGASSGIGLVTARRAALAGAAVVLAARNEAALADIVDDIRRRGGSAVAVTADVGIESDVARIADTAISTYGRFDTWVNNAGVAMFGSADQVSVDDMHRLFDTNYWGAVYGSLALARHIAGRQDGIHGGALIMVGSTLGNRAIAAQSTYSGSKHALRGYTDAFRSEQEAKGSPVSVTLVHPGRIDTPHVEHAHHYPGARRPHARLRQPPETVANAILRAAQLPVRDVYVGAWSRSAAVASAIAPGTTDRLVTRYLRWSLRSGRPTTAETTTETRSDEPDHSGTSALHYFGSGGRERGRHR